MSNEVTLLQVFKIMGGEIETFGFKYGRNHFGLMKS